MKKLAILGAIFLSLNSFAQDMAVQNVDHNEVLFRGYENKLILGQKVGNSDNFQIEAINCEVSKLDGKGSENT